jgi:hypothetical protein
MGSDGPGPAIATDLCEANNSNCKTLPNSMCKASPSKDVTTEVDLPMHGMYSNRKALPKSMCDNPRSKDVATEVDRPMHDSTENLSAGPTTEADDLNMLSLGGPSSSTSAHCTKESTHALDDSECSLDQYGDEDCIAT